jgi:4-hydroxybenzoate polyprenyltransferase
MLSPDASPQPTPLPRRRSPLRAALVALRPRQWLKNLLLFAGILFAAELSDGTRWVEAIAAFVAYCAASSAAYLVNDVCDVEADRQHPVKRRRPIARGELRPRTAIVLAVVLAGVAAALGAALGPWSLGLLLVFVSIQAAYTLALKHIVLVDVAVIALLFVIRAAAGAVAVDVRISPWLLACTALLALFIALGKRRAELLVVGAERTPGRAVLEGYSLSLVDQLLAAVAGATVVAYTTYTLSGGVVPRALVVTIPFVVFGIVRYLQLLHRHALGEEPENVLLGDLPILLTVAAWAVTCGAILVLT